MRHEETFKIRIDGGLLGRLRAYAEHEQCSVAYLIRRYVVRGLETDVGDVFPVRDVPKISQVPTKIGEPVKNEKPIGKVEEAQPDWAQEALKKLDRPKNADPVEEIDED